MSYLKASDYQDMMNFLFMVLNENKQQNKKSHLLYYTIYLIRFGGKLPVLNREPTTTDIKGQIEKYGYTGNFKPDYLVVEIFTGRSRNVKKPIAAFKFDFKSRS